MNQITWTSFSEEFKKVAKKLSKKEKSVYEAAQLAGRDRAETGKLKAEAGKMKIKGLGASPSVSESKGSGAAVNKAVAKSRSLSERLQEIRKDNPTVSTTVHPHEGAAVSRKASNLSAVRSAEASPGWGKRIFSGARNAFGRIGRAGKIGLGVGLGGAAIGAGYAMTRNKKEQE